MELAAAAVAWDEPALALAYIFDIKLKDGNLHPHMTHEAKHLREEPSSSLPELGEPSSGVAVISTSWPVR